MPRLEDLKRFYNLMDRLEENTGGKRKLKDYDPEMYQTHGGVYFFFEEGEIRKRSGSGERIVRVGKCQSYRARIKRHHKGDIDKNHKGKTKPLTGSVFRKWIANALFIKNRKGKFAKWPDITMMNFKDMPAVLNLEQRWQLEQLIRQHMWPMHLLFVPIPVENSRRYMERNAIGLLSEYGEVKPIDSSSKHWLGCHSREKKIRNSGLWNSDFVTRGYEPGFLDKLGKYVDRAGHPPIR